MKKRIEIEGMMCNGCSSAVKGALEEIEQVSSACADHTKGEAIVELVADVADEVLENAVEALDFVVNEISVVE